MKSPRIISIGPLAEWVKAQFEPEFQVETTGDADRNGVLEILDDSVVALIARGPVIVDAEILERAPSLKLVARTGVGYDSVVVEEASSRLIPVLYTPGAMTRGVAEHAFALILAAVKKLNIWREALGRGHWEVRYEETSLDLEGKILGIVGYGRIGRQLRMLARSFDLKVIANDPYIDHARYLEDEVEFVGFETLLQESEIISLHVPLTEETRGMIHSGNLPLLRRGAILINTARGPVVESLDFLHRALGEGVLEAAAMDVFPDEPPDPRHPLLRHPRAYVTGHVAARSPHSQRRILETMVGDMRAVLKGFQPVLENVVNPEVLDRLDLRPRSR